MTAWSTSQTALCKKHRPICLLAGNEALQLPPFRLALPSVGLVHSLLTSSRTVLRRTTSACLGHGFRIAAISWPQLFLSFRWPTWKQPATDYCHDLKPLQPGSVHVKLRSFDRPMAELNEANSSHFIAITVPGLHTAEHESNLVKLAEMKINKGFKRRVIPTRFSTKAGCGSCKRIPDL